jgi:hypothetical protein
MSTIFHYKNIIIIVLRGLVVRYGTREVPKSVLNKKHKDHVKPSDKWPVHRELI